MPQGFFIVGGPGLDSMSPERRSKATSQPRESDRRAGSKGEALVYKGEGGG